MRVSGQVSTQATYMSLILYKPVRYSSVSLNPTLGRNEKIEQYIRKKTHKSNSLRFWVDGGVIPLYGFGSVLIV